MPMKNFLLLFTSACIIMPLLLVSCATNKPTPPPRHAVAVKKNNSPKFIDSVYIKAHNARGTAYAGELHKKPSGVTTINTIKPVSQQKAATQTTTAEPNFITYINTDKPTITYNPTKVTSPPVSKKQNAVAVTDVVKDTAKENEHAAEWNDALMDETDPLVSKYAAMIAMDPKKITNYPLYHFVDEWYGTAYKWGGNDLDGIDCSGFSQKLYEDIYGLDLQRTVRQQRKSCDRIKDEEEALQGDLVFFRIRRFRVSHVGVYLANGYFVHASSSHGVVISNMNDKYWHRRFAGYGRIEKDNAVSESDYTP